MATVRFGKSLRAEILGAARNLFGDRIRKASAQFDARDYAEEIYRSVVPYNLEELLKNVPGDFLTYTTKIRVARAFGVPLPGQSDITFVSPRVWPTKLGTYGGVRHWQDSRDPTIVSLHPCEEFNEIHRALNKREEEIAALCAQRDTLVAEVAKLIGKHATLSPALREWPALWDLLSPEVKEDHRRIVERPTKKDDEVAIDLDAVTAIITTNRMFN